MNIATIICGLLVLNCLTFALYGLDKRAARLGGWRVPENSLLLLSLLGGSPAAYIASKYFRHKTSKRDFVLRFWLIIITQIIGLSLFFMLR